jgi:hypothetical protein
MKQTTNDNYVYFTVKHHPNIQDNTDFKARYFERNWHLTQFQ